MTFRTVSLCILSFAAVQLVTPAAAQQLCGVVVTTLVPQLSFRRPVTDLRRVEVRKCRPETAENLQVVAWEQGSASPSLVVETFDFTIVQVLMRQNVFVIETARDAYDTALVITYDQGKPKVSLQKTIRQPVVIQATDMEVKVSLTDSNGRVDTYTYALKTR